MASKKERSCWKKKVGLWRYATGGKMGWGADSVALSISTRTTATPCQLKKHSHVTMRGQASKAS
jgi:hypothetical protein